MMSYRYDKKKKVQQRWYAALAIVFLLILFTPIYGWLFGVVETPIVQTFENREEFSISGKNFFQTFDSKSKVLAENKRLVLENQRLSIDNLRTTYLAEELERVYGFVSKGTDIIPAHVLHHGTFGNRDSLLIDQGENSGIIFGDHVVSDNNISLGFISEVYPNSSQVTLFSEEQQMIEGILFPHDVQLQAGGNGGGSLIIETPREIDVQVGDIFYGLEEPGYIIGIVREVIFDPRDPFKKVHISYPENMNRIHTVGVKKALIQNNE
jgi:cell shape-determining protein MreC